MFLGECPNGYVVNHKDGNPLNNNVSNLEYISQSDNIRHSIIVLHKTRTIQGNEAKHICEDYNNGIRLFELAYKYKRNSYVIDRVLRRYGVKINNPSSRDYQQPSHKYTYERFND